MRLLHTSDWHLGVSMNDASCEAEQSRFLDWLIDTLDERAIDVLVVAGDIFHLRQPSNSAQRLYFDFLRRAAEIQSLQQVVVVAGNHDSPSGLESPRRILETMDITVVGDVASDEGDEHYLVPVKGSDGDVELVLCAVPYVRTAQLGVSAFDGTPEDVRRAFEEAFSELYTRLADTAHERWGAVRLVATGHLTCAGDRSPDKEDYNTGIHSVGTIDALEASIFDERYDYVALGHIHRAFPVEKPRIWYSGTPIPTSKTETSTRYVIDVDLSEATPDCELIEIPRWRDVIELDGDVEEVVDALGALHTDCELSPYVFTHLRQEGFDYEESPFERLQAVIEDFDEPRPRIVEYRETDMRSVEDDGDPPAQLDELTPEEVFVRLYESRNDNRSPDDTLLRAFRELLADDDVGDEEQSAETSELAEEMA